MAQPVFRVTPIPNGSPTDLARKAASLRQYLETHLGMKVDFAHGADNAAAAVRALVRREVHLAGLAG